MPFITPKYAIAAPSPSTKLRDIGTEMVAMATSIERVLDEFEYNGAHPDHILPRVIDLETGHQAQATQLASLAGSVTTTQQSVATLAASVKPEWAGVGSVPVVNAGTAVNIYFPLPEGRFTQPPVAVATPTTSRLTAAVTAATAEGITVNVANWSGGAAAASQMHVIVRQAG